MSPTNTGRRAESVAADYLRSRGFKILDQNWRTRYCEIDIVARKHDVIYFVEVKYRAQAYQGAGLEYITAAKLRQMRFAAELWVSSHDWQNDYQLAAIEVSGERFIVTACIEEI